MKGKRVIALNDVSVNIKKGTVGTIVDVVGHEYLLHVKTVLDEPIIESISVSEVKPAFYNDVKDLDAKNLVLPHLHPGKHFKVVQPGTFTKIGINEGTIIEVQSIQLTSDIASDTFRVEGDGKIFDVSFLFLEQSCTPFEEVKEPIKEIPEFRPGTRLRKKTPSNPNELLSKDTVVTVLGQEDDKLSVGFVVIDRDVVLNDCNVDDFEELTEEQLSDYPPERIIDPLFGLGNRFSAKPDVEHVVTLQHDYKANDEIIIVGIKKISTNALEDVFIVKDITTLYELEITSALLATYFVHLDKIPLKSPDQLEKHFTGKIELPSDVMVDKRFVNTSFENDFAKELAGELGKTIPEVNKILKSNPELNTVALNTPGVEITGLRIHGYGFKIEDNFIKQGDIPVGALGDYIVALQKLAEIVRHG